MQSGYEGRFYDCDFVVGFCVASSVVFSTMAFKAEYLNEARWGMLKSTHRVCMVLGGVILLQVAGVGMPSTADMIEKSIRDLTQLMEYV
jgi:hypothetical protein